MVYFFPVFSQFHTKIMLAYSCFIVMWLFSSILVPGELFLIHFQRYVCANRKFCLKPQIPLRFPVKTENHWLYIIIFTQLEYNSVFARSLSIIFKTISFISSNKSSSISSISKSNPCYDFYLVCRSALVIIIIIIVIIIIIIIIKRHLKC